MAPVSLNQEENMTVAGTAKLLLFTNEQGKTNNETQGLVPVSLSHKEKISKTC